MPTESSKTEPSVLPLGDVPQPAGTGGKKKQTYGQILKSSALIGGSSMFNVGLGIVRTKVMATLLGRDGIGMMGLYNSVADLALNLVGMGINSSGVRQIAEAAGSGEIERIARTATVLRRTALVLGIIGALLVVALCVPISNWTFGSPHYAAPVALLSLAVLFRTICDGQGALIQGMRRIADLARSGILGGLLGTVLTLGLIYFFREQGIVPSLIGVAAMSLAITWWYRRKIALPVVSVTSAQMSKEASALLKLGLAFSACGILTTGAAYLVRIIVVRNVGLDAAGLYQSAWALGGQYVGIILQAMGSDFYPRLTAVAHDDEECNRLVNEQAEVGLLMAGPGVIVTLTFAPLVIALFYTREFAPAVDPLRWICLGLMLRVIAWPMGFIVLAKNWQGIFFLTEVAATAVHVGLAWIAVQRFGLAGAGMAFFGLYVWHSVLIYVIVHRLTGFRWSAANKKIGPMMLFLIGLVFIGFYLLPFWAAVVIGTTAAAGSGIYSMRLLARLIPPDRMPRILRRVLTLFRLLPPAPKE